MLKKLSRKIFAACLSFLCVFSLVACTSGTKSSSDSDAIQSGDIAKIDFVGKIDGEEFSGGSSEDFIIEVGSGQLIDGFEDQLIDHKTGDEFDIVVTFPDDYGVESLNGKEATFTTTVKGVYKSVE